MSFYFALLTVENNKSKRSVKFQGDMLNSVILFRFLYLPQITTLSCLVKRAPADIAQYRFFSLKSWAALLFVGYSFAEAGIFSFWVGLEMRIY